MAPSRLSLALVAVSGCALALGLASCAAPPPEPPAAAPGPAATPAPTASLEPAPNSQQVRIPSCDELVPIEDVRALVGDDRYVLIPLEGSALASAHTGSVAAETLRNAIQSQACVWGIPNSDGFVQIVVAEITDPAKTTFTAALNDSDFAHQLAGDVAMYTNGPVQGLGPNYLTHLFRGNVWISEFSWGPDPAVGKQALAAVLSANSS